MSLLVIPQTLVLSVQKCYIGALEVYENPRTLTMLDLMEVNTYKLMDCNVAHHTKEIVQVNNRKYSFGNEEGAYDWVCSKVPDNGRIKKDCVPKREAPPWYKHLLLNRDFRGCNGAVCYCDDQDGCNKSFKYYARLWMLVSPFLLIFLF